MYFEARRAGWRSKYTPWFTLYRWGVRIWIGPYLFCVGNHYPREHLTDCDIHIGKPCDC